MVCIGGCVTGDESISEGLQVSAATVFDFFSALGQGSEEIIDLFAHMNCLAKADVGGHVLADPVPDGFIGIEIRAVARQSDQPQIQIRGGQILAYLSSAMGGAVVPDDD